ncbi:hypothetical protein K0H71_04850 [Bacillus sp. IITD106]|nr:hypothetical protein [Bacillus sp. IITD106]
MKVLELNFTANVTFGPQVIRSPIMLTPFSLKRSKSSWICGVMKQPTAFRLPPSCVHEKPNRPPSSADSWRNKAGIVHVAGSERFPSDSKNLKMDIFIPGSTLWLSVGWHPKFF